MSNARMTNGGSRAFHQVPEEEEDKAEAVHLGYVAARARLAATERPLGQKGSHILALTI